jgi:hypothetical protein
MTSQIQTLATELKAAEERVKFLYDLIEGHVIRVQKQWRTTRERMIVGKSLARAVKAVTVSLTDLACMALFRGGVTTPFVVALQGVVGFHLDFLSSITNSKSLKCGGRKHSLITCNVKEVCEDAKAKTLAPVAGERGSLLSEESDTRSFIQPTADRPHSVSG